MKLRLKNIASVQMGYSFRTRLEQAGGQTAVIQMKDLTDDNRVDCEQLVRVEMEGLKKHHLVQTGDLIFRSRGLVTTAAILTEDPGVAVVAAPLFRIRVAHEAVSPQYLHWFINQPPAQKFLTSHSRGTAQQMIGMAALEDLEIALPPIARQRAIVELAGLAEQEQKLIRDIAGKRRQYLSTMLLQSTEGE